MSCCGKVKKVIEKSLHIAQAYTSLAVENISGKEVMKYERTEERIEICRKCEFKNWKNNNRSLWCKLCGCYVPGKARIENENCPKGLWEILKNGN
jgi:hypothetical protein